MIGDVPECEVYGDVCPRDSPAKCGAWDCVCTEGTDKCRECREMMREQGVETIVREQGHRNYKCPRCDGEFNEWNIISSAISDKQKAVCPFCGLESGTYTALDDVKHNWRSDSDE